MNSARLGRERARTQLVSRRGAPETRRAELAQEQVDLHGLSHLRQVACPLEADEIAAEHLGEALASRERDDRVIGAVDDHRRARDAPAELLDGLPIDEARASPLDGDQDLGRRVEPPRDAVLDVLRRVGLGEDLPEEELEEAAIVATPRSGGCSAPSPRSGRARRRTRRGTRPGSAAAGTARSGRRGRARRPARDARRRATGPAALPARRPRHRQIAHRRRRAPRPRLQRARARHRPRDRAVGPRARCRGHRTSRRGSGGRGSGSAPSSAASARSTRWAGAASSAPAHRSSPSGGGPHRARARHARRGAVPRIRCRHGPRASDPRFEHEVEGRLGRAAEPSESARGDDIADPRLAGLCSEGEPDLL